MRTIVNYCMVICTLENCSIAEELLYNTQIMTKSAFYSVYSICLINIRQIHTL